MSKKISLIILGILLIALAEWGLGLAGKAFLYARVFERPLTGKNPAKLILCIGDSHTFGVGAAYQHSYPKQLEKLLNLNNPQTLYRVVNSGIPGNSTRNQVERLAAFLKNNNPQLVIMLTGRNNYYEVKSWKNHSLISRAVTEIQKMRLYRMMRYALVRFFNVGIRDNLNACMDRAGYEDYMYFQLRRAKTLCQRQGCKLVLLSYYSTHDPVVARAAGRLGILYFNLNQDFLQDREKACRFVSRDNSHMNFKGYKLFSEFLYRKLCLHKEELGLDLKPLSREAFARSADQDLDASYSVYLAGKSIFY